MQLLANAADRLYKIAYMLPPKMGVPSNMAFTIKLPVPTVLLNARLMFEVMQVTPPSHRMAFMDQLQPLLQYLMGTWEKLSVHTSLDALQSKTVEMNALRQVTLFLHQIYPTVGVPGERMMVNGFSLGYSSDPLVVQKASKLTTLFQNIAKTKGDKMYSVSIKYDLQIAENLNRVDPRAVWEMSNPTMFGKEPQLTFMPLHMETFQKGNPNLFGKNSTGKLKFIYYGVN